MGSTLAGVKAGVIAGLVYIGALAISNVIVLYASEPDVLTYITNNFAQVCSPVPTVNSTTVQDCFASLAPVYLPYVAFIGFIVTLVYSGVFGRFYDLIPGKSFRFKGLVIAPLVAINLLVFQLVGITFEVSATVVLMIVLIGSTIAYGLLLGGLYKRYTRVVQFVSQDESALKIIVGRSNLTGKSRTFAAKSSHEVRADVADDSSFRGWTVSGGVTVEDPKSFETSMEVNGDGLLKALVTKKH
ncbi:MAG: hypothetical protein LYZ70_07460 [Nitrososphaerales archaeon]|nr:hypothetical protein [Nitrososphaerales archaeon]